MSLLHTVTFINTEAPVATKFLVGLYIVHCRGHNTVHTHFVICT